MLKIATLDDFNTVKTYALNFLEVSGYKDFSDLEDIDNLITELLAFTGTDAIVLLGEGGMLAGVAKPFIFGSTKRVASEVAWWVEPDARKNGIGKELLEAFEFWAKEKAGCALVTMVSIDDLVGKFYEKNGYKLYERAYMKVL